MEELLTTKEANLLTEFYRYTEKISKNSEGQIRTNLLLSENELLDYIKWYKTIIQAPTNFVTASQFIKGYGFLICIPSLVSMTAFSKQLNVSPSNCYIGPEVQGEHWLPRLRLQDKSIKKNQFEDRKEWTGYCLRQIFKDHLSKIIELTSNTFKVPLQILWENVAIYVFWLYETSLKEHNVIKDVQIEEDFQYILNAPGDVFGADQNPLSPFFVQKTTSGTNEVRFRKTCCFAYELPNKLGYCKTCPKLKAMNEIEITYLDRSSAC